MSTAKPRPHIICHMITSIDGRLLADRWPCEEETLLEIYDAAADRLEADGWIVGRATMQAHYLDAAEPAPSEEMGPREDCVAPDDKALEGVGICIDRKGRLQPESGEIEGAHLVMVLGPDVAASHAEALVGRGVSVFFLGEGDAALAEVLGRIGAAFGIGRLILEGGGEINGAFLAEGLIDETSTLVYPVVDGQGGGPAIYEHRGKTDVRPLELISVEALSGGCVWMRHRVSAAAGASAGDPQ